MNLFQWRKKKNLTMAGASVALDVSQPTISRIESGAQLPGPQTIAKLAKATDGAITAPDLYKYWEAQREVAQ